MKTIRVVAAVIHEGDKVFATARGYGKFKGLWEFPGGKIEDDETPSQALIRKIKEALDVDIEVGELLDNIEYDYSTFHLSMDCFWAKIIEGKLVLKEEEDAKWLDRDKLDSVRWLPADSTLIEKINRKLLIDECIKYTEEELLQISGVETIIALTKLEIENINKRKMKNSISKKCLGKRLWALFGYVDDVNMICLQVASSNDIVSEIVNDICCMLPICDGDTKVWGSEFHKKIFSVTYRMDPKCQKYRDMYLNFDTFYIVSIDHKLYLKNEKEIKFETLKYAEIMFAFVTKSLYWKPFGEECKILKAIKEKIDGNIDE